LSKDSVSNREAKQQCLQGVDAEAVTIETALSADVEMRTNNDDYEDAESDEVEEGELISSSSSSESELEPEETVPEKGKRLPGPFAPSVVNFSRQLTQPPGHYNARSRDTSANSERKCADTTGTVPVPWAGHFHW